MIDSTVLVSILRNRSWNRCSVKSRIGCGDSADRCLREPRCLRMFQSRGWPGGKRKHIVGKSLRRWTGLLFGFLFRQEGELERWQHGNGRRESAAVTRYGY